MHEGQAGFRVNRSCMDNVYTLNEIVQGRFREDKESIRYCVARWSVVKLWDMGVKGRMWRVIKKMYEASRSTVLRRGEVSYVRCRTRRGSLSLSVFINDLLKDEEQAELGIQLSSGKRVGGMLFADDFVGVTDSRESLQKLIDVVHVISGD